MLDFYQQVFTIPGTLAANHVFTCKVPIGTTITHVSFSNSSANAGTLDIGNAADDDCYLDAFTAGVSGTPHNTGRSGFVGGEYPHVAQSEVLVITVTDHASHMANVCVVLSFEAG